MRVEEYRSCSSTANRVNKYSHSSEVFCSKDQMLMSVEKDLIVSSLVAMVHNSS